MLRNYFYLLTFLACQIGFSQNLIGHINDSKSGESIAYANIISDQKLATISNAEGCFSILENLNSDSFIFTISHLGYVERILTFGELKSLNYNVQLDPVAYELETVFVSNEKLDAYTIMNKVQQNIKTNYPVNKVPSKQLFFLRESNTLKPTKFNIKINKSSGYDKKELNNANLDFNIFSAKIKAHPPIEMKDILGNIYSVANQKNNPLTANKLEVLKATMVKNGNNSTEALDMKQILENIFLKHIDSTKYYRFKSGLFGSRDTISFTKEFNEKKNDIKKRRLLFTKNNLLETLKLNSFINDDKLNFVTKPNLYNYEYIGKLYSDQDELVYILKFKPKKNTAKYTGTLYISAADYAVLRCEYNLVDGEILDELNLKFLLGIKTIVNNSKGTAIFKKDTNFGGYYLKYFSMETGKYIYVNRPIKLIEIAKTDKEVVAFDFEVEGNETNTTEFLNISNSSINETSFKNFKEKEFKFLKIKRYDPKIWAGHTTIEPLDEMKQINSTD